METLLVATHNKGKENEFKDILGHKYIIKTLNDYPELPEIEETGTTFRENAALKAEAIANLTGLMVISDDSGLIIDELGGAPAVYSARWAGEPCNDHNNNMKLERELAKADKELSTARYHCTIALAEPSKETLFFEGVLEGFIKNKPAGDKGFAYDPYFYSVHSNKLSLGQINSEIKNLISHRGNAIEKLSEHLREK